MSSAICLNLNQSKILSSGKELNHYQTTNLDWFKLKEFADDNLKFEENGRKLSKQVENTVLRAISPFPTVFSKGLFSRGVKRCYCVGMG